MVRSGAEKLLLLLLAVVIEIDVVAGLVAVVDELVLEVEPLDAVVISGLLVGVTASKLKIL